MVCYIEAMIQLMVINNKRPMVVRSKHIAFEYCKDPLYEFHYKKQNYSLPWHKDQRSTYIDVLQNQIPGNTWSHINIETACRIYM